MELQEFLSWLQLENLKLKVTKDKQKLNRLQTAVDLIEEFMQDRKDSEEKIE